MKKILVITAALLAAFTSFAQTKNGGISAAMLSEIQKGYEGTPSDKAIRNALNGTPIAILSENAENMAMIDTDFSDKVRTKGITDQKSSGRCWLFTGLNVLRAKAITEHDLGDFEFSENYIFFYDQLEKANLFLQSVIDTRDRSFEDRTVDWLFQNPMSDGGQFTGVSNLITKYGLVPASVMPESYCANNTSSWTTHFKTLLRKDGLMLREGNKSAKELQQMKVDMLKEVYHVLGLTLGVPPTEFEWKGEKYTPMSFYQKYVGKDLENNYVMVMNDPCREYYKVYEIEYDRHVYDGQNWVYINLPIEKIKEMAIASIKDDTAMYFSCDVAKYLDRSKGVMDLDNFDYESLLGVSLAMNKEQRVRTHASGSSHAMTLMAVDLKDGVPQKWMVENSWGAGSGYNGYLIMTDEWFDEYMFRLVLEKKYVPQDVLDLLKQKPLMLQAWDPMFLPEE